MSSLRGSGALLETWFHYILISDFLETHCVGHSFQPMVTLLPLAVECWYYICKQPCSAWVIILYLLLSFGQAYKHHGECEGQKTTLENRFFPSTF